MSTNGSDNHSPPVSLAKTGRVAGVATII